MAVENHSELHGAFPPPLPAPAPLVSNCLSHSSVVGVAARRAVVTFQFTVPNNSFAHSISTLFIAS